MYFFDSYALVELIKNKPSFDKFKNAIIITSALNIAETHFVLLSVLSESKANEAIKNMDITLIEPDKDIAIAASSFRYHNKKMRLSYADCLGYCMAQAKNLMFVTGDEAFKEMKGVEFVK
mgnify:CR=1 FL=1